MIPFPDKKYKIIYADPPWEYENVKTGGDSRGSGPVSGAAQKYDVMSLEDICSLPVQNISDKDCVCFLWGTTPLMPEAFTVLEAWGFKYKTAVYWRKIPNMGLGFWFRGQVEFCLVGIKGEIKAFHSQRPNFIQTRAEEHSKKPMVMLGIIDEIAQKYNLFPKIELFSRDKIEGWDSWGNEVPTSEQKRLVKSDTTEDPDWCFEKGAKGWI